MTDDISHATGRDADSKDYRLDSRQYLPEQPRDHAPPPAETTGSKDRQYLPEQPPRMTSFACEF